MNLKQYLETGVVVTLRDNSQFLIMNNMVNVMGQKENVGISFPITEIQGEYIYLNDYSNDLRCSNDCCTDEEVVLVTRANVKTGVIEEECILTKEALKRRKEEFKDDKETHYYFKYLILQK